MPFTAVSGISNIFGNKEGDDVLFTNLLNVNVCSLQTIRSLLSDYSPLLLHINSSVDLPKMIYILYNKFTMTKNSFLIINNCFSSKVDLYYGNDSISKASLVLQLRAKLESSAFKNFYKE